jgi:tetratricopeptide (TPR) repeat protein
MTEKKIRKVISTQLPLKSFGNNFGAEAEKPKPEFIAQVLKNKFGDFPGEISLSVNQTDVHLKWYAPRVDAAAEKLHRKAIELARDREFNQAIENWKQAIDLNAADPDYHFYLGIAYLEIKKPQDALDPLNMVVTLCPVYPKAFLYLGTLYLKLRKFEQAEKYIRESLFFFPQYAPSYLNLGIIYSILRNHEKAIEMYQQAILLEPKEPRAFLGLAKIYSLQGEVDEANVCFHKVIELDKTQQLANYAKRAIVKTPVETTHERPQAESVESNATAEESYSEGYLCYLSGDYPKAEAMYKHYLSLKPTDAHVWFSLGEAQMRSNKLADAITSFKKAISIEEKSTYHKELALAFCLSGQAILAFGEVQAAINSGKKDSLVYALGGQSLFEQQKYTEAVEMLEESIRLNRNNFRARFYLAKSLKESGKIQLAVAQLEELNNFKINFPFKQEAQQLLAKILSKEQAQ